jgi:hypothetical protein
MVFGIVVAGRDAAVTVADEVDCAKVSCGVND